MAVIGGTAQGETLRGTVDADQIFALGGSDTVFARSGNDLVDGGAGLDTLNGELGNDRLFGDDGPDFVYGGAGSDRAFGGTGNDFLFDRANGADGNDVFDGGAGRDLVSFADQAVGVRLTLADGGADSRAFQGGEVDVLRAVEDVQGSRGADVILGNSAANQLFGSGGSDRLEGRGGNDFLNGNGTLNGRAGNDTIEGGIGHVRALGGTGADSIVAGAELAPRASDVDRSDLGSDGVRDRFNAGITLDFDGDFGQGFGVERVANVRAQDVLNINFSAVGGTFLTAGDYLDSDGNGVVNNADRDASLVGGNLVLDIDQLFEREASPPSDLGVQQVILEQIASINADQFV